MLFSTRYSDEHKTYTKYARINSTVVLDLNASIGLLNDVSKGSRLPIFWDDGECAFCDELDVAADMIFEDEDRNLELEYPFLLIKRIFIEFDPNFPKLRKNAIFLTLICTNLYEFYVHSTFYYSRHASNL